LKLSVIQAFAGNASTASPKKLLYFVVAVTWKDSDGIRWSISRSTRSRDSIVEIEVSGLILRHSE